MQSPFRIQSARRIMTTKNDTRGHFFSSKKKATTATYTEKESLQDTIIQLRCEINRLIQENKALNLEILHMEKRLGKQEKVLKLNATAKTDDKHTEQSEQLRIYTDETCRIAAFTRQVRALEKQLADKELIVNELKRDVRITRLSEVQIECKSYKEQYEDALKQLQAYEHQDKFKRKNAILKENVILQLQVQELQGLYTQTQMKLKKKEHEYQNCLQNMKFLEKMVEDKDEEINLTKMEYSNPKRSILEANKVCNHKLLNMENQINSYLFELGEQQNKMNALQTQYKDLQHSSTMKENIMKKEVEGLYEQIKHLRLQIQTLEEEDDESEDDSNNQQSDRQMKSKSVCKKRISKVNFHDVNQIGLELSAKLKLQQIPFNKLSGYLESIVEDDKISINSAIVLFQGVPFNLNEEQSKLLSRFLVEPEQEDWVFYDPYATNSFAIASSILKNLIKPYELIPESQYPDMIQQIKKLVMGDSSKVSDYLQVQFGESCGFVDIMKGLDYCDITLDAKLQNYLSMRVYERFHSYNSIKHKQLFDLFR